MDLEKFTERSRGFLQAAQTIAARESHQRLAPEHLLKALMDDEQGMATNLIRAAGGGEDHLLWAVFAGLCVCGVTTFVQAVKVGRVGAGYILLMGTSGAFIAVSVSALAERGPGLLATLVIASSLFQFLLAHGSVLVKVTVPLYLEKA